MVPHYKVLKIEGMFACRLVVLGYLLVADFCCCCGGRGGKSVSLFDFVFGFVVFFLWKKSVRIRDLRPGKA